MDFPELKKLTGYSFEIGPIRPPSEGGSHSLLLRATRNCPWNLCKFCYGSPYNREQFQLRNVEEVNRDIDAAKKISELIETMVRKIGGMDWVSGLIDTHYLYNKGYMDLNPKEMQNFHCIANVFHWLYSGGKSAFLQDANSLIMPPNKLIAEIKYLKLTFPSLQRITSYARAKTLAQKNRTLKQLKELRQAGLTRLHIGLETGDDELLKRINKGVTSEEHVLAGKKALEAGLELSEYWMPGLGGKNMSEQHAKHTALVLNKINPDFVRSRPFVPRKGTPMFEEWRKGEFKVLTPHEELHEIQKVIAHLNIQGAVCFDHFVNPLYKLGTRYVHLFKVDFEGYKFPEEKPKVLELVKDGLEIDEKSYVHIKDLIDRPL